MNYSKIQMTDPRFALVFMALFLFVSGITLTYISSVLTTLEKRFNFNSMELGVLMGSNDIGYLVSVFFVTYFGSKTNRQPFMLFLSGILLWISCMVYAIPYFIYGPKYSAESLININVTGGKGLCLNHSQEGLQQKVIGTELSSQEKSFTFFILIVAGILSGVSSTPLWSIGISFLDDLVGPAKSGIYIGTLYVTRTLSPIVGFLIGSHILKYHESLQIMVYQYGPGQRDLKWIGAWWLGWVVFGFAVLIPASFMLLVKKKKPSLITNDEDKSQKLEFLSEGKPVVQEEKERIEITLNPEIENVDLNVNYDNQNETKKTILDDLIELFNILKNNIQNRIFMSLVIGMIFEIVSFVCLLTFFTKYLEYHFRVSTSIANIMSAICLAGSNMISAFTSGLISHFYKPTLREMNRYHAIVNTVSATLYPILFIFTCPSTNIHGLNQESKMSMCSNQCNCQIKNMEPVCYNLTTVFSPCIAGCKTRLNETFYSNCGCDDSQFAFKGFCETMCPSVYGFLIVLFLTRVIGSVAMVQFTQILMRLAKPEHKAMNLSIISFIFGICGLALPPLAGIILDTACKYRNIDTFGMESHCIIYDNDKMRYLILGFSFGLQIPACIFYILSWVLTPANYVYGNSRKSSKVAT